MKKINLFVCVLLTLLTSVNTYSDELSIKVRNLIECCKWGEAADLIESGANPFVDQSPRFTESNALTNSVSACFASITRMPEAYRYGDYSDIFRIAKATVMHPEFSNYISNNQSHPILDQFAAIFLFSNKQAENLLYEEMTKKGFHFSKLEYYYFFQNFKKNNTKAFDILKYYTISSPNMSQNLGSDFLDYLFDDVSANYSPVNYLLSLGYKFHSNATASWLFDEDYQRYKEKSISEVENNLDFLLQNGADQISNQPEFLGDLSHKLIKRHFTDADALCDNDDRTAGVTPENFELINFLIRKYHAPMSPTVAGLDLITMFRFGFIMDNTYLDKYDYERKCNKLNVIMTQLQTLFDAGYDINSIYETNGPTLLYSAINYAWPYDLIEFLLKNGADQTMITKGRTPEQLCNLKGKYCSNVKKILKKYKK